MIRLIVNISSFYGILNSHFVKHDAESDANRHFHSSSFRSRDFISFHHRKIFADVHKKDGKQTAEELRMSAEI